MVKLRLRPSDVALAGLGAVALIVEGLVGHEGAMSPGAYLLAIAAATPLAWRTRKPLAALIGVEVGALLCVVAFHASWSATAIVLVELYTVALLGDRQRSLVVGTITAIGVVFVIVLIDGSVDLGGVAIRVPLVFASVALGDMVRSRRALRAAAEERAERLERERDDEIRRREGAERLRIARELHDTLAHFLVAINVRSSVAVDLPESQDPSEALRDIKQVSATALRDLRATLNLLRDQDDVAPRAPAFDLEALPTLVERARSAGVSADIEVHVNGAVVPSVIGGAAFRIVQEALTNVLRHADASSAHVRVTANADALNVEITDDGRAGNGRPSAGGGHGLRGMAERAEALGGRVSAGPRRDGGWGVHAVLPLRNAEDRS
ncbi:MAG TPA: histidine kinase [Solirubrobacteraceae bacterium]|nr:histidine kinase [Solirubrobacteraceae bacterium]